MTIYWCLIAYVIFVGMSVPYFSFKDKKKTIVILSVLGIVLVQGLRAGVVGTDLRSYLPAFNMSRNWDLFGGYKYQNYEIGFSLFTQLLSRLGVSETGYLLIISLIIHVLIGIVIYKYSAMPTLSFIIYICMGIFTFSFSGLRQAIAIAILFVSYICIRERKLIPFLILVALAISMHATAIVFLPAYWLCNMKIERKHYIIIVPITVAIFIFRRQLYILIYQIYKGGSPIVTDTGAYAMLFLMVLILISSYLFDPESVKFKGTQMA